MTDKLTDTARWRAIVYYRTECGIIDVEHWLSEIVDLDDCVERGPHWDTIEKIKIYRVNHCSGINLTVEAAEKL